MTPCVWIDLGDGDFIKPNFTKDPSPEAIERMRQWGLKSKQENKELAAKGLCLLCKGEGKRQQRDLDSPEFKLAMLPCRTCGGTGKAKP